MHVVQSKYRNRSRSFKEGNKDNLDLLKLKIGGISGLYKCVFKIVFV